MDELVEILAAIEVKAEAVVGVTEAAAATETDEIQKLLKYLLYIAQ